VNNNKIINLGFLNAKILQAAERTLVWNSPVTNTLPVIAE